MGGSGAATEYTSGERGRSGVGAVHARSEHGRTVLSVVRATSPLRFVRPTFAGSRAAAVCLVTFGGGLVDGDAIDVDLTVDAGATLVVFTQATTKAFRGHSRQTIRARVAGTLVLLPDPVACFADASYRQRVDVDLTGEGSVVALDGFTSGRAAFGDRWAMRSLDLATTFTRDGVVLARDALRLARSDGPIAPRLDAFEAMATLVTMGARVRRVTESVMAPSVRTHDVVAASSTLHDGALARIAATTPERALAEARRRLRNLADIDVVDPFASRH